MYSFSVDVASVINYAKKRIVTGAHLNLNRRQSSIITIPSQIVLWNGKKLNQKEKKM